MIESNKYVKVFFNNGSSCEGKVISWSYEEVVLTAENGNLLYLFNIKENVNMVKVFAHEKINDKHTVDAIA